MSFGTGGDERVSINSVGVTQITKGTSGGAITFNGAFTFPTADGSANQVLQTDGSGNISWATVSVDSLATGGITYDDNKITGQRSNENIEIEANGSGVIETGSSIIPKTDNSVDLGSSSKRFKEGYFAAGTVHIGDQTIKSTASGFVFSGGISTSGKQVTANDDTTSTIINKKGLGTSEATVESYATSANDSVLYYVVSRDEVNDMITAQKVTTIHNNTTGFASTSNVTKTGTSTDMTFDGSISGGSMRLRATGGSFSNSLSAYKISLGDNSSAGTSGNTAVVINADVDSATENLDTWAHASYRGAKYFISVNDEADDELETLEAMVTHNGTDAFITVYNNVRTGSTGLITLTADISGANVRLRGAGSRANLNVKMHRILLSDSETAYTGNQMAIVPATTISSSATAIDTFNVNDVHGAFYYVTSTIANGDSCMAELVVATDGTDAYATTGPIISSEGTDQLSFTATISGDIVTISAASSSGGSTTVNAYRINLKRDAEADVANTVLLSGAQTISGNKTFTDSTELKFGSDGDANIKHTGTNLNIQETTGDINLRTYANDKDVIISTDDGSGGITEYLVADGSTGAVKLKHYGTTVFETTTTGASITNTSTDDALLVTTTEDSSTAGPVISLKRNSSSPADADYLGQIKFKGENDADQEVVYVKVTGKIQDATDGTEDGILEFANKKAGSNVITARLRSDSLQLLNGTSLVVAGLTYPTSDGTSGQVLQTDGSGTLSFATVSSGTSGVTVQEEGSSLSTAGTTLNFVGSGVTASGTGSTKTITVSGGEITVQDEGSALSTAASTLNFVGSGVVASGTGSTKTITISGSGSSQSAAYKEYLYVASGSQATFTGADANGDTLSYTAGFLNVYLNGVKLIPSTDFTASNGTSVVLVNAASANDVIQIETFVQVLGFGDSALSELSGDGSNTTYSITHSFGTPIVQVQVLHYGDNGSGATYDVVHVEVERDTDNAVDIIFGTAPTTAEDYLVSVSYTHLTLPTILLV